MTTNQVQRALDGYRELVQVLSAARTPEFPDPSVTMAQMRVLMLLEAVGETKMSGLAPRLGISLSTLSSLVDRLVEARLAQRREDATDRRSVLVSLTPEGSALLGKLQELGVEQLRGLFELLSDQEVETVIQAIELLTDAARRLPPEETR